MQVIYDDYVAGMHILMVTDVYFPRVNGVSTSIRSFRRELQAQGHRVTLIAPRYPHSAQHDQQFPDADLIRVASLPIPRDPEDRLMRYRQVLQLIPQLQPLTPDVVHIQTPFVAHYAGLALARALQLPVIESYHTFFEEYLYHYIPLPKALLRFIARHFTVAQCNAVQQVIAPSRAMHDALRAYGVHTPITILPTGLEKTQFTPGDGVRFRAAHDIHADRPVALYIGRVAHEKNIDFLLRAFKDAQQAVPRALLLIVGEGPARTHLQQLATQLGIGAATRFLGYLDRDSALLDCYRAGDVFIFASRTETQGLVLLEALAQGTPVLSTAHMGTHDILQAAKGAQVVPENVAQFAAALTELLSQPAKRQQLAQHAIADAAGWSTAEMTTRLIQLYKGGAAHTAPAIRSFANS